MSTPANAATAEPKPSASATAAPSASAPPPIEPSAAPLAAPLPAPKRRYVVAAMGDSLTDARSHGGKYLELLQKRCPLSRFDNYGRGGHMVNQMRKRFGVEILNVDGNGNPVDPAKPRYSHVLVLGGINDIISDESANRTNDKIRADLSAMYKMAKGGGVTVVAITMPPWAGLAKWYNERRSVSTREINDWIKARLPAGEIDAVVDIYPIMSCGRAEYLCEKYGWPDQVHWSKEGHVVVGEKLHAEIFSDCE